MYTKLDSHLINRKRLTVSVLVYDRLLEKEKKYLSSIYNNVKWFNHCVPDTVHIHIDLHSRSLRSRMIEHIRDHFCARAIYLICPKTLCEFHRSSRSISDRKTDPRRCNPFPPSIRDLSYVGAWWFRSSFSQGRSRKITMTEGVVKMINV